MQGLSALQESTLYCTQAFFFASVTMCELQPFLNPRALSAVPAVHASKIGGRAQRGCKYARCTPLVPHPSLPPRTPSNPRHTLYLLMC